MRTPIIMLGLLTTALFAQSTQNPINVLILDPVHSESGQFCTSVLSSCSLFSVQRIDLSSVDKALEKKWDVIIAVRPDPANYSKSAHTALKQLFERPGTGLFVFGIPSMEENLKKCYQFIGSRSPAEPGIHFTNNFEGSYWIWTQKDASPKSTVYFRKSFTLERLPTLADLQITTDNRGQVWLNGKLIGGNSDWMSSQTYSVQRYLRVGNNVVCVKAFNEDGPAGLILSLNAYNINPILQFGLYSDKTWKQSETHEEGWRETTFDDSLWNNAREFGRMGDAPWSTNVKSDYQSYVRSIRVSDKKHFVTKSLPAGELGNTALFDGLTVKDGAVELLNAEGIAVAAAGDSLIGRTIILSIYPERYRPSARKMDLLESQDFGNFILRAVIWLAGKTEHSVIPDYFVPKNQEKQQVETSPRLNFANSFPAAVQICSLPYPDVLHPPDIPRLNAGLRTIIDNIINHGFTVLSVSDSISDASERYVLDYAQSRGMMINYSSSGAELFGRDVKNYPCVYSPEYERKVKEKVQSILKPLERIKKLHSAFVYQDEPFYAGSASFSYNKYIQSEFKKRYGYDLPPDLKSIRNDPRKWLDVINFRADYFPDGWRKVYRIIKDINPNFDVILTHDSHNTFGGGVGHEEQLAINDVFHWGADFADTFVFDIYPYMMTDFRYGERIAFPEPRMAMTHYAMGQMRNLTTTYGKTFGFWFGSFNSYWFKLTDKQRKRYWSEREMVYTAVANGADFLIAGYGIPQDYKHWENLGEGLKLIQKSAASLKKMPRIKSKAAFLFPRTQYIQLQEEYWNVALAYELFLRTFGELDIIHEEQVTDANMNGYKMVVLFDVKLLPEEIAKRIAEFVNNGGIVIADNIPKLGKYRQPMHILDKLFAQAGGVKKVGKGKTYLLGFRVQDAYFSALKQNNQSALNWLRQKFEGIFSDAKIRSHVHSSTPDIETAIRANDREGFLFVINHESTNIRTVITLADLPFQIERAVNLVDDKPTSFKRTNDTIQLELSVPINKPLVIQLSLLH